MILAIFKVSGHSMEPSFKSGQILLVSSLPYLFGKPKLNDIVVVRHPKTQKLLLKRIKKIQSKKFFVVGDNPNHSTDSRSFGPVLKEQFVGKVIFRLN